MDPHAFVARYSPGANEVQLKYSVPWQVTVAQAALETGWLAHPIRDSKTHRDSHNLFAIKADASWHGRTATIATTEIVNGQEVVTRDVFRAYASDAEALTDRTQFLLTNPRYERALARAHDPVAFAQELQAAGYATDPHYADKLIAIMREFMGVPTL